MKKIILFCFWCLFSNFSIADQNFYAPHPQLEVSLSLIYKKNNKLVNVKDIKNINLSTDIPETSVCAIDYLMYLNNILQNTNDIDVLNKINTNINKLAFLKKNKPIKNEGSQLLLGDSDESESNKEKVNLSIEDISNTKQSENTPTIIKLVIEGSTHIVGHDSKNRSCHGEGGFKQEFLFALEKALDDLSSKYDNSQLKWENDNLKKKNDLLQSFINSSQN